MVLMIDDAIALLDQNGLQLTVISAPLAEHVHTRFCVGGATQLHV